MSDGAMKAVRNLLREAAMNLSRHYKRAFMPQGCIGRDAEIVLADLRKYCRGTESTFHPDAYQAARLQGRREVWLRITGLLHLDEDEVHKLMEIDDGI